MSAVAYRVEGDVAVLTVDTPPVNALGLAVRQGLLAGLERAVADDAVAAVVLICAGSTFIVFLVGLFTGMAFTVSTIVGFRQFSAEGMVGGVVALALTRELAPVLASVVVTARAGSTMASELGNMRVTEQIDAITTMGVSPVQYLVVPRVVATTLVLPLLAEPFLHKRRAERGDLARADLLR